MTFIKETIRDLNTCWQFQCRMCSKKTNIIGQKPEAVDVNPISISAAISVGQFCRKEVTNI